MKKKSLIAFLLLIFFLSCKVQSEKKDSMQDKKAVQESFVTYLNHVNAIDSTYRIKHDTLLAIKMYGELFKKYPPHNSYLIDEYQTYIILSDRYNKDFGGKNSLYKLIPLLAPNWKYNKMNKDFFSLYKKYGIDSLEMEDRVSEWKNNLNRRLRDSFAIASFRDMQKNRDDRSLNGINDRKNLNTLLWTLDKYGYPSLQKIGLWSDDGQFMTLNSILTHMTYTEAYPYLKDKLYEYVLSGECEPIDYAGMVDRYATLKKTETVYGMYKGDVIKDSVKVNRNRKAIGLPSLKHIKQIREDYFKN
ncbi:hypothetical protein [uncultured Chryseobacterium sp.]|uniref:hypothetical protein n=1 Tax=uncultured Chryseobacterium sp. TaxID=259322 RepID=UPI0025CD8F90|nr:hypothetical protein [uncultured Chryseobacterium sp.]